MDKEQKEMLEFLENLREEILCNKYIESENYFQDVVEDNPCSFVSFPYPIEDNGETILTRTAQEINEHRLNPYEVNWMEVTLYLERYVKILLELINLDLIDHVADAIEQKEKSEKSSNYLSNSYTTNPNIHYYSYTPSPEVKNVSASNIAKVIKEQKYKAQEYAKKAGLIGNGPDRLESGNSTEKETVATKYNLTLAQVLYLVHKLDISNKPTARKWALLLHVLTGYSYNTLRKNFPNNTRGVYDTNTGKNFLKKKTEDVDNLIDSLENQFKL